MDINEARAQADLSKVFAEIEKIIAETRKLQVESRWYPFVLGAALFASAAAFVKLLM